MGLTNTKIFFPTFHVMNKDQNVQESDTTGVEKGKKADNKKIITKSLN